MTTKAETTTIAAIEFPESFRGLEVGIVGNGDADDVDEATLEVEIIEERESAAEVELLLPVSGEEVAKLGEVELDVVGMEVIEVDVIGLVDGEGVEAGELDPPKVHTPFVPNGIYITERLTRSKAMRDFLTLGPK